MNVEIEIRSHKRGRLWSVEHAGHEILGPCKVPFRDAARRLHGLGIAADDDTLVMRHVGDDRVVMTGIVGKLRLETVIERGDRGMEIAKWSPSPFAAEPATERLP